MKTAPTSRINKLVLFKDLGYEPHPGQLEIHQSAAHRRVVASGTRWGKTTAAAMEGITAALEPKEQSIGWVVAPTYDLADRVFREIELVALKHLRHRVVAMRESERRILLRNMAGGLSEIRAKSADNPVSLLGEGLDWVIVDEASRLKPAIWQSHISQRLVDKRGWALLISTPKGKGYFYDLYRRGRSGDDPEWRSWNYPSWTNPLLDKELIEREREHLPERVFRQEFGAEFIEGSGAVFRNVREAATGAFEAPSPTKRYLAGLDLAKVEDFTVLSILDRDRNLVHVDRFHRVDWPIQVQRIRESLERYQRAWVHVDSTGVGEPIYETLLRAGVNALAYPFTSRSKAALVDNLALLFEQRKICIPRPELWPEGIDELESFEYSVTEAGNVKTSAPSGCHDDIVVSMALAAWHLRVQQQIRCVRVIGMY